MSNLWVFEEQWFLGKLKYLDFQQHQISAITQCKKFLFLHQVLVLP